MCGGRLCDIVSPGSRVDDRMTGDCPGVGADHCMAAAASLLTDVHVTVSPLVTALHCWAQLGEVAGAGGRHCSHQM